MKRHDKVSAASDARGATRLAVDLTVLVTDIVENLHHNIARPSRIFGAATLAPTRGLTGFIYRRVRGVARLVGSAVDAALAPLVPMLSQSPPIAWPGRDAVIGALNGVLGDHLESTGNPLGIRMHLRRDGVPLESSKEELRRSVQHPNARLIVMVHGLCVTDTVWSLRAHDHGKRLAQDLRADVVYLRYNSGQHVSTNGRELAQVLERTMASWPVPVNELLLVGHSMGGLVIRSACAAGIASKHRWIRRARALVFLGTPHFGAPLERGGHGVDILFGATPYTVPFTRLSRLRSAGITDLRYGSVIDEDWQGRDRFAHRGYLRHAQPLPANVPAFAIAGSLSDGPDQRGRARRGDGLVPVASALAQHADPAMALDLPASHRWVAYRTGHLDLLGSEAVYARMKMWLADS